MSIAFVEPRFAGRRWRKWESDRAIVMHVGVHFQRHRRLRLLRRASVRWVGIGVQTAITISVRNAMCLSTTWCIAVQGVASSAGVNCTKKEVTIN